VTAFVGSERLVNTVAGHPLTSCVISDPYLKDVVIGAVDSVENRRPCTSEAVSACWLPVDNWAEKVHWVGIDTGAGPAAHTEYHRRS